MGCNEVVTGWIPMGKTSGRAMAGPCERRHFRPYHRVLSYDQLLDAELERIYPQLQRQGWLQSSPTGLKRTSLARGAFLEPLIVLILVLELVLLFAGVMSL